MDINVFIGSSNELKSENDTLKLEIHDLNERTSDYFNIKPLDWTVIKHSITRLSSF